ncbi:MAG TPA: segregation/condensation protein A [Bacteroidales bacterium]|nr:segregation/condensation protein A [Bacteroidales bacterium]
MFNIKTEKFSGPLDLLLRLIEERNLEITDISLSNVTNEYLEYIKQVEYSTNELADFLVIASTLILIKSKSILPTLELSSEETEEILDLKERLILYRIFKQKSQLISEISKEKNILFSHQPFAEVEVIFSPPNNLTLEMFKNAFENLLDIYQKEKIILPTKKIKILVNLKERINNLLSMFRNKDKCNFKDITNNKEDKINMVVTFLAVLHLAKDGFITLNQEDNFGDINIECSKN